MGVYLQSPIKDKNIKKGENAAIAFVSAEMQGTLLLMQAGEKLWKMPLSTS